MSLIPAAVAAQVGWFRLPTGVFVSGGDGLWDAQHRRHPTVVRLDGTYHMWFAGEGAAAGAIGYARSADGILWTEYPANPVLADGRSGSFDAEFVDHPAVLVEEAGFRLYYAGYDGALLRIGCAGSTDGVTWTRMGPEAVLAPGSAGAWDAGGVTAPAPLRTDGGYALWYAGYDGTCMRIGYATSSDGLSWEKHAAGPVLDIGPPEAWDDAGVSEPVVLYDGRQYRMWYTGFDGSRRRLGYATSADGVHWEKSLANPVFQEGAAGGWDGMAISGPAVIRQDNTYRLWYTGFDGARYQIGYASSQIPGDIDSDGTISVMDAVLVLQYVVRLIEDFPIQALSSPKEVQPLDEYVVEVGEAYGLPGERVEVPLSIPDASGLYACGLRLAYDPQVLRAVEATPRPLLNGSYWQANTRIPGEVSCAFITATPLADGGELFRLAFDVLGDAAAEGTPLRLTDATLNKGVQVVLQPGAVHTTPAWPRLLPAYPNPFNPTTTIPLHLPRAAAVELVVFDAGGQQVRHLLQGVLPAGLHRLAWDGRADGGRPAASGVYVCRLRAGDRQETRKLLLVR